MIWGFLEAGSWDHCSMWHSGLEENLKAFNYLTNLPINFYKL